MNRKEDPTYSEDNRQNRRKLTSVNVFDEDLMSVNSSKLEKKKLVSTEIKKLLQTPVPTLGRFGGGPAAILGKYMGSRNIMN